MAKKTSNKKTTSKGGRPPLVPKAGIKHGTKYCGGGKLKK